MPNIIDNNSVNIIFTIHWPQLHKKWLFSTKCKTMQFTGKSDIRLLDTEKIRIIYNTDTYISVKYSKRNILIIDKTDCYPIFKLNIKLIKSIYNKLQIGGYFVFHTSGWSDKIIDKIMKKYGFQQCDDQLLCLIGFSSDEMNQLNIFDKIPENLFDNEKWYENSKEDDDIGFYRSIYKC